MNKDSVYLLALKIVRKRENWVGKHNALRSRITDAVAEGIKQGIELGRQQERDETNDRVARMGASQ